MRPREIGQSPSGRGKAGGGGPCRPEKGLRKSPLFDALSKRLLEKVEREGGEQRWRPERGQFDNFKESSRKRRGGQFKTERKEMGLRQPKVKGKPSASGRLARMGRIEIQ